MILLKYRKYHKRNTIKKETMTDNSIRKDKIGNLHLNDDVVVDCVLSDYLDKQEGGDVSGTVNII